ncbi:MAG: pyrimidine dimer DNA glycosylase/endonuclease V [Corynebacterium sp.]|uniref:pyrimidine dimer DNA glycosylase/endonuclease V n=1 Tax=Corynebacterium sp. TaxID=1720 RepID=UPI0026E037B2|nr:pyrimidine dimer DNA glycosylase/endonuclease V [Corynebacterium sp.]MDO5670087.1 pyrimidine dimer DNA glycosylase/endonuclease V [Corynebacterium sp.]
MRLWSLHPRYLDQKGLVACWRETLLAQKVLTGNTRGYRNHPQLTRFRAHEDPLLAVSVYLQGLHEDSVARGYNFDAGKILRRGKVSLIDVTYGQLAHELAHLRDKLVQRAPERVVDLPSPEEIEPHPLFRIIPGPVEDWERV